MPGKNASFVIFSKLYTWQYEIKKLNKPAVCVIPWSLRRANLQTLIVYLTINHFHLRFSFFDRRKCDISITWITWIIIDQRNNLQSLRQSNYKKLICNKFMEKKLSAEPKWTIKHSDTFYSENGNAYLTVFSWAITVMQSILPETFGKTHVRYI